MDTMIADLSWLAVGILLSLGRLAVAALPYAAGVCVVLVVVLLGAIAVHEATSAVRREQEIEQTAAGAPDDTAPLSSYELAVLAAIENGELYDNRSSE